MSNNVVLHNSRLKDLHRIMGNSIALDLTQRSKRTHALLYQLYTKEGTAMLTFDDHELARDLEHELEPFVQSDTLRLDRLIGKYGPDFPMCNAKGKKDSESELDETGSMDSDVGLLSDIPGNEKEQIENGKDQVPLSTSTDGSRAKDLKPQSEKVEANHSGISLERSLSGSSGLATQNRISASPTELGPTTFPNGISSNSTLDSKKESVGSTKNIEENKRSREDSPNSLDSLFSSLDQIDEEDGEEIFECPQITEISEEIDTKNLPEKKQGLIRMIKKQRTHSLRRSPGSKHLLQTLKRVCAKTIGETGKVSPRVDKKKLIHEIFSSRLDLGRIHKDEETQEKLLIFGLDISGSCDDLNVLLYPLLSELFVELEKEGMTPGIYFESNGRPVSFWINGIEYDYQEYCYRYTLCPNNDEHEERFIHSVLRDRRCGMIYISDSDTFCGYPEALRIMARQKNMNMMAVFFSNYTNYDSPAIQENFVALCRPAIKYYTYVNGIKRFDIHTLIHDLERTKNVK